MKNFFIVALCLISTSVKADWRQHFPDLDCDSAPNLVRVHIEEKQDSIFITNISKSDIVYSTDGRTLRPYFEELIDGKWSDTHWAWCGTGISRLHLKPGETKQFLLKPPPLESKYRIYTMIFDTSTQKTVLLRIYESS